MKLSLEKERCSFHMTVDKELFSDLEEKYLQMHIEMGDDG